MKFTATIAFTAMAAVLFSGCGLGAGSQEGTANLLVSRDYGRDVMVDTTLDDLTESENAIRVLDGNAEIETRYGGGFIQSIDGVEGGTPGGRSSDWFFSVNGVVSEVGGAEFPINAGDTVWWDYRDWTDAMEIGAVIGSYPAPMSTGYKGEIWPVIIDCRSTRPACDRAHDALAEEGVTSEVVVDRSQPEAETLRIVVGRWSEIKTDSETAPLESKPSASGIFARFESGPGGDSLVGLDVEGEPARDFGNAAGLIAATRRGSGAPTWFVTGGSDQAVALAAGALDRKSLEHRYAAVASEGSVESLPLP
ncbi:MAG: DUF4430 domain-containing protein [Solirubrobacterales bacterium]